MCQSLGNAHLQKSSCAKSICLSLGVPKLLNKKRYTSCLKGITVGNVLLDPRFSKIAACNASVELETVSDGGFGEIYALNKS